MPVHAADRATAFSAIISPDGRTSLPVHWTIPFACGISRNGTPRDVAHLAEVWALRSPDGQTLASGTKDGGVKMWALGKLNEDELFRGASMPLAFSKDGGTLVALAGDSAVGFFNSRTGELEQRFPLEGSGRRLHPFAFSTDLRMLVQAISDGSLKISNLAGGESRSLPATGRAVEWLALSPDSRILITGSTDEQPRWWDLAAGTSEPWPVDATRVLFSPDGRTVAVFSWDNVVQLWDAATRKLRTTVQVESELSKSAAFSSDGLFFASAWQNDTIRLWDVFTGALLGTFVGHKQPVFSVAFSPDGRTLASSGDDSTVRLWNVATQQELLVVRRLGETLTSVLFSPDGRLLLGGARYPARSEVLRVFRAPLLSETEPADRPK